MTTMAPHTIMKKRVILLVLVLFVGSLMASASDMAFAKAKKASPSLQTQISQLEAKIKVTKNMVTKAKLTAQLNALKAKWAAMQAPSPAPASQYVAPAPAPAPQYVAPAPAPTAPQYVSPKPTMAYAKMADWELNGNAGLVAGVIGANAALNYNIPQGWTGMSGWAVRGGAGLASGTFTGSAATKKVGYLYGDAIYNLPVEWTGGLETYGGAGINLPVAGSGTGGLIGGSVFYGIQTADPFGMGGKLYGEVGYVVLRGKAGSGISQKSANALVGWRYPLAF